MPVRDAWGPLRGIVRDRFTFADMKDLAAAAGLPVQRLAHLRQGSAGYTSKGELMNSIEGLLMELPKEQQDAVVSAYAYQVLARQPALRADLVSVFTRLGLSIESDGSLVPSQALHADDQETPASSEQVWLAERANEAGLTNSQRWRVLAYLYRGLQYKVAVVGTGKTFEGREVLVLSSGHDIGAYDGLSAFGVLPEVEVSTLRSLASDGYLEVSRRDASGTYQLNITAKGVQAVQARQQRLLQVIYDYFRETAEWPKYRQLGRQLVREMDVQLVAQSLPLGYINADRAHHANYGDIENSEEAIITVPSIYLCDGSGSDLGDFIRALQLCVQRHFDSSNLGTPKLTREDLERELEMPDLTARKVIRLMVREPGVSAGGLTEFDSPSWWMNISDYVARYEGVQSIEEYLDRRPVTFYSGLPRPPFGYPLVASGSRDQPSIPSKVDGSGTTKEQSMKLRLTTQQKEMLRTLYKFHEELDIGAINAYRFTGDGSETLDLELDNSAGLQGETVTTEYDMSVVEPLRSVGYIGMKEAGRDVYQLWITAEGLELVDRDFEEASPRSTTVGTADTRAMLVYPIFVGRGFTTDTSKVFVLSPFREPFNAIYRDHIRPAVESLGLTCGRADDIYDNTPIMEDVWRGINEAGIIISDLTGRNPNVFYETGIAHTLGKEVILISQNNDDVPFDLRHLRFYPYSTQLRGPQTLEEDLKRAVNTIRRRLS